MVRLFETKPGRFLAYLLLAQLVLWTAVPTLFYASAPLDVLENVGRGHEWRLGYFNGPPLQAWLTEAAFLAGRGRIGLVYLLSQGAVVLTQLGLYALARDMVGQRRAIWAVVLFSLVYYANLPTPEFNANLIQTPIWIWASFAAHRAIRRAQPVWWLLLGALLGAGVYAQYSVGVLAVAVATAVLSQPEGRRALRTPWPWLATALALALAAPQLAWLGRNHFLPIFYTAKLNQHGMVGGLLAMVRFVAAQIVDHALPIALLAFGGARLGRKVDAAHPAVATPDDRRFALTLPASAYAATLAGGLLTGISLRCMWGAPMAPWVTLAAVVLLSPLVRPERTRTVVAAWLALFLALPIGTAAAAHLSARRETPPKTAFPAQQVARGLTEIWNNQTLTPLDVVAGGAWESGLLAAYSPDRPSVFVDANFRYNPWITPQRLTERGVMVVWTGSDDPPANLQALGPFDARGTVRARYPHGDKLAAVSWAIRAPGAGSPK